MSLTSSISWGIKTCLPSVLSVCTAMQHELRTDKMVINSMSRAQGYTAVPVCADYHSQIGDSSVSNALPGRDVCLRAAVELHAA